MTDGGAREAEGRGASKLGRLLASAEGYQVLSSDGHYVGVVEHLRYQAHTDRPDEIVIARRNFLWKRRRTVAFDHVEAVRPADATVVLRIDRTASEQLPAA